MEKYARRGYVITCTALRHKPIEIHSDLIKVYEQTRLCFGTLNNITTKHLDMTKKENRWVLHFFSNENKKKRLDFANQMLHKFDYGKWRISEILTADECIFYLSKIDKKR